MIGPAARSFTRAALASRRTWLVLTLLALAVLGFFLWFSPAPLAAVGFVALVLTLFALWLYLLAGDRAFQSRYHQLASRVDQRTVLRLYRLETELRRLGARASADLLSAVRDRFDSLTRLLVRRLHHREIAYGRHLDQAETILLDLLRRIETLLPPLEDWSAAQDPGLAVDAALETNGEASTTEIGEVARLARHLDRVHQVFDELGRNLRHTGLTVPHAEVKPLFAELERLAGEKL